MYIKNIECEETKMEDAIVLMNKEDGSVHILNETASFIWEQIEKNTIEDVINIMLSKYENINNADIANDVKNIIQSFVEKGLMEVS